MHKRQFHFIFVVYHMQQFELYHILMIIHFMIYFHEYNRLNIIFCTFWTLSTRKKEFLEGSK